MSRKLLVDLLLGVALLFSAVAALVICGLWLGAIQPGSRGRLLAVPPLHDAQPRITVIHFTAPWCGPCREQRPRYDRIQKQHQHGCNFQEADADSDKAVFQANHVSRIPAYIVFDGSREAFRTTSVDELGQWLNESEALDEPRSHYEKDHHLRAGEQPINGI